MLYIICFQKIKILENKHCIFKSNSVLTQIGDVLIFIPFKNQNIISFNCTSVYVHCQMYIICCASVSYHTRLCLR